MESLLLVLWNLTVGTCPCVLSALPRSSPTSPNLSSRSCPRASAGQPCPKSPSVSCMQGSQDPGFLDLGFNFVFIAPDKIQVI